VGIYVKGADLYPAIVKLERGLFEVRFVDLPNCMAVGKSPREAESRAEEALAIWAGFAEKHCRSMPKPSSLPRRADTAREYTAYIPLGSPRNAELPRPEAPLTYP